HTNTLPNPLLLHPPALHPHLPSFPTRRSSDLSGGSIGLSFAMPSSVAEEVVQQLKDKGRVDRGWLGVAIQEVNRDLASSLGLDKPTGALVADVEPDGPAAKAGIKAGDLIIKFNGRNVNTQAD